ncbi:MAG: DUF2185 domain-containing protein [Gammaproteobacteria bacterium]|jgi:hypothetical protein|nr:DUF2185 domain-containing protein [Gammaproteobacteria bacterium]
MGSDKNTMGTAFATKLVAEQHRKVKFMYRESPSGPSDSGWHFFCGEEPQEYVDDPNNSGTYPLSLIVEIDPCVASLLDIPAPCGFERDSDDGTFWESDFDLWPEE